METTFENITAALPNLPRGQQQDLLVRLQFLLGDAGKVAAKAQNKRTHLRGGKLGEQEVWSCVVEVLGAECRQPPMTFAAMRRTPFAKAFREGHVPVLAFVQTAGLRGRLERMHLIRMGVLFLVRHFQAGRVPVGYKTISQSLQRVPEMIEDQFPGYASNGLLHLAIKTRCRD